MTSHILPRMDEWAVFPRVAVAAGLAAQEEGVARLTKDVRRSTPMRPGSCVMPATPSACSCGRA